MKPMIKEAISIPVVTWSTILQLMIVAQLASTFASAEVPVMLKPLCSDRHAGVRWTADKEVVRTIDVNFQCMYMDQQNNKVITFEEDSCFQGDGIPRLTTISENSRAHIISTELQPGTVCIFTAQSENNFFEDLGTVSANCTIKDPSTCESNPNVCALPAYCTSTLEGQDCQCSCTQGYSGRADSGIAGVTCMSDVIQTGSTPDLQTLNVSATSLDGSDYTSQNTYSILVTPTSAFSLSHPGWSISSGNNMAVVMYTSTKSMTLRESSVMASSPTTAVTRNAPADRSQSMSNFPTLSSTITQPTQPASSGNRFPVEEVFPAFLVAFLLSVTVIVCCAWVGVYLLKRKRLQRLHSKLTVPFYELRVEKIDPDFNPVTPDKVWFIAESLQSIFHTLETSANSEKHSIVVDSKNPAEEKCEQITTFTTETDSTMSLDLLTESLDFEGEEVKELSEDIISNMDDLSQAEFSDHSVMNSSTLSVNIGGGYIRDIPLLSHPSDCMQVPQTAQNDSMVPYHTDTDLQYPTSLVSTSANTNLSSSNSSSSGYVLQSTLLSGNSMPPFPPPSGMSMPPFPPPSGMSMPPFPPPSGMSMPPFPPPSPNVQLDIDELCQTNDAPVHLATTHNLSHSLNPNISNSCAKQNNTLPARNTNLHIAPAALHMCDQDRYMSSISPCEQIEQGRHDFVGTNTKFVSSDGSTEISQDVNSSLQEEPLVFVVDDGGSKSSKQEYVTLKVTHPTFADESCCTVQMTGDSSHDNNVRTGSDKPKVYFSFPHGWSEIST